MRDQEAKFSEKEVARIIKILELSTSSVDAEALAAIRTAQRILKKNDSNYEMLIEAIKDRTRENIENEILKLQDLVHKQSGEIKQLRKKTANPASSLTKESIFSAPKSVQGSIYHLKNFLLNRLTLQNYERKILEDISNITPKSREEYLVLICARRHKITFKQH